MDGRNSNGTFQKGHSYSKGNPFARQLCEMRAVLYSRVGSEDFAAVVDKLVSLAKDGSVAAAKLLIEHLCGKPVAKVELTGADGEPLAGLSLADVQLAVIGALADEPSAKDKVADALKLLYKRSQNGNGG